MAPPTMDERMTSIRKQVTSETTTAHIHEHRLNAPHYKAQEHTQTQRSQSALSKRCLNSSASSTPISNVASFLRKTPREGMSRSMRLQCCAPDESHACYPLLFVIRQSSAPLRPSLSLERELPDGKRGNPRFSDSSRNATVTLSEPCRGAPADETIIHECGQCFYMVMEGRS